MIKVEVIAHSENAETGREVCTILATFPRFILPEVLTHRVFERNTASSRAMPYWTMVKEVLKNPAMPVRFGRANKGMQDGGSLTGWRAWVCKNLWRKARYPAIAMSYLAYKAGLAKQVVNRLLEPWVWTTMVITATEWENFYRLRIHKDAQPEIQELARKMLEAHAASQPRILNDGEWHLPFIRKEERFGQLANDLVKRSVARVARTSYVNFYGKDSVEDDLKLYERLLEGRHMSPFGHICQPAKAGTYANLKDFKSFRHELTEDTWDSDDQPDFKALYQELTQ